MSTDTANHEADRDRDKGESERGDKKHKSSGAKTKDLSHVPCKFFKVGGCTAGASCPFSHLTHEPGQQKEVCTWFVKGNCKFGHKCALAHILPGQSMAMDRKNKKAAQAAAGDKSKTASRPAGKKDPGPSAVNKLPLLTGGATAPTRTLNSPSSGPGRPPINMPLKATISPSAPAPPLKDTDFASFAPLDGLDRDNSSDESPSNDALAPEPVPLPPSAPRPSTTRNINDFGPIGSPTYRTGHPISPIHANGSNASPAPSPSHIIHHDSPSHNGPLSAPGNQEYFVSTSFSMRGQGIPQSLGSGLAMRKAFDDSKDIVPNSYSGLLSTHLSSSVSHASGVNGFGRSEYDIAIEYDEFSGAKRNAQKGMDSAVDDEELEDFLPSSLNDLLTPEERSRRMSRSNSAQKSGMSHLSSALASANLGMEQTSAGNHTEGAPTGGNGNLGLGHRYSHSVPAPTLLADIKSIWSDSTTTHPIASSPLRGGGIPSATISATLGSGNNNINNARVHAHADEAALSLSLSVGGGTPSSLGMISPSNASAAFLPGLHKHYLDAKAKQAQQAQQFGIRGPPGGIRGASNPVFAGSNNNNGVGAANNYLQPLGPGQGTGMASSVSNPTGLHMHIHGNTSTAYRTTPSPFDLTQTLIHQQPQQGQGHAGRGMPSNLTSQVSSSTTSTGTTTTTTRGGVDVGDPLLLGGSTVLSPGSRALQSHAPGQSLPQGLAAGYSRIHALPPLTNLASPPGNGSGMSFGVGIGSSGGGGDEPFGEWATTTTGGGGGMGQQQNAGLDSMFSRFSYAATTRTASGSHGAPPGLSRNVSGGKYNHPLSPLSGPVVTRDDDILFDMDK